MTTIFIPEHCVLEYRLVLILPEPDFRKHLVPELLKIAGTPQDARSVVRTVSLAAAKFLNDHEPEDKIVRKLAANFGNIVSAFIVDNQPAQLETHKMLVALGANV